MRIELLRQALEASRRELKQGVVTAFVLEPCDCHHSSEYEQLSRLEHGNRRREERLVRVRGKDLRSKEELALVGSPTP